MTDLGPHQPAFAELVKVPSVARVVHGLLLHTHWASAYVQELSPEGRQLQQLRRVRDLLDEVLRLDPAPLTVLRWGLQTLRGSRHGSAPFPRYTRPGTLRLRHIF